MSKFLNTAFQTPIILNYDTEYIQLGKENYQVRTTTITFAFQISTTKEV